MIIYTDRFLKDWMGGRQFWFMCIIRPRHRGNLGIVEHEKEHIKQWWLTTLVGFIILGFAAFVANRHAGINLQLYLGLVMLPPSLHGTLYLVYKPYRMWAEVRAHRVSVRYRPDRFEHYANALATHYKLGISVSTARGLLK